MALELRFEWKSSWNNGRHLLVPLLYDLKEIRNRVHSMRIGNTLKIHNIWLSELTILWQNGFNQFWFIFIWFEFYLPFIQLFFTIKTLSHLIWFWDRNRNEWKHQNDLKHCELKWQRLFMQMKYFPKKLSINFITTYYIEHWWQIPSWENLEIRTCNSMLFVLLS